MARFVNAAPKLKKQIPRVSFQIPRSRAIIEADDTPPPTDTWSLAWINIYKPKLITFDRFYDDSGKEKTSGLLSNDSGFKNLVTDAARRSLVAEVKSKKGVVKFEKQGYCDVSSNNFIYLPDSDVVVVGEDAIQTPITKLEYAARWACFFCGFFVL